MRITDFVCETRDNNQEWDGIFEKYDYVFTAKDEDFDAFFERFKQALADYLFDLRVGNKHLQEHIESFYRFVFKNRDSGCAKVLLEFLQDFNKLRYDEAPDQFLGALSDYAKKSEDKLQISVEEFCEKTEQLLYILRPEIRDHFVQLDDKVSAKTESLEFAQMTGQIGEILATLVFEQVRRCGAFVKAKIDLDNPNLSRHGEDLLAFMFDPIDSDQDELYFVEAKSSKRSISAAVEDVRDRFRSHLKKIPTYEVTRLKLEIEDKLGSEQSKLPRSRLSDLLWAAKLSPENSKVKFSSFLHYPDNYSPRKSTLKKLGDIKIVTKNGEFQVAPSRIHVLVFQFQDFERTIKEIFERAWTI